MKVMLIIFLVLASLMSITIMTAVIMDMVKDFKANKKKKAEELDAADTYGRR